MRNTAGDMVSDAALPAELIPPCMDVLLKLSSQEKDFLRVVVEIVQNVREDANAANAATDAEADDDEEEDDDDDLDLDTATPEQIAQDQRRRQLKAAKKIQNQQLDPERKDVYLRCLGLVRALLERTVGVRQIFRTSAKPFHGTSNTCIWLNLVHSVCLRLLQSVQDNATLIGMIHELIVPSVKSKEPEIREQGLLCLGLCSLLDKVSVFAVASLSCASCHVEIMSVYVPRRTWPSMHSGSTSTNRKRPRASCKSRSSRSSLTSSCSTASISSK